ncbi:MAG: oligosaccharide flippase family protein [Clostridia bacterium]|nr:oligosaccharide flippase family protein [Clostridia bacterium]
MNNKRLTISMVASIVAFVVNAGIGFLLTPYIVNNVGYDAYGFVSLANNFTNYAQILTIALNSMAGRFITISLVQKKYDEANRYFTSTFYANLIMAIVLFVISTVFVFKLENFVNVSDAILVDIKSLFSLVFAAFLVTLIGSAFSVATFAANRKDLEAKRNIEAHVIKVVIIVCLFAIFSPHVYYVGIASLLMTLYTFAANLYYTKKLIPEIVIGRKNFNFSKVTELIKSGIWSSFTRLGSVLSDGLDLLVANLFIGADAMGVLSVAKMLPNVISPFIGTIGGVFAPSYTIAYANDDKKQLEREMRKSMLILSWVSNLCIAVLIVLGKPFFSLWVPDMDSFALQILSTITVIYLAVEGVVQCVWNVFTITNKLKLNSIVTVATGFINILIVYILIRTTDLGVLAVAGVSVTTSILRTLFFSIPHAAKCIDMKKRTFYIPVFKSIFALAVSVGFGYLLCSRLAPDSWFDLVIAAIPIAIFTTAATVLLMTKPSKLKSMIFTFFNTLKKQ